MKLTKYELIILAILVVLVILYFIGVKGFAFGVGKAAADAVGGAATGVVYGASDFVGLENPDQAKCRQAKQDGDAWGASFACPAGEFFKYIFK